jgi:ParB/RepB/Spo0J family partition protein
MPVVDGVVGCHPTRLLTVPITSSRHPIPVNFPRTRECPNVERKESKSKLYRVPIRQIVANTNPRDPLSPELQKIGYGVFQSSEGLPSLWSLATSDDPGKRNHYVQLIQTHDPELAGFAANILAVGQLQPVEVRDNGKRSDGQCTYTLVFGCRRCLAVLFNWCVLGKPAEPVVEAVLTKGNEVTLLHRAVSENIRKDPNPIEVAKSLQYAINGGETREELAKQYGVSPQTIDNRLALLELPVPIQKLVAEGKLMPTRALAMLRSERADQAPTPPRPRIRPRKEIEERYQAVVNQNGTDQAAIERAVLKWILQLD